MRWLSATLFHERAEPDLLVDVLIIGNLASASMEVGLGIQARVLILLV